ncbi:hypothetical protein [uncultured Roseibium sp.]|uniref:hypothetical protein n=1 Tax=uncultured Roseibium sp. TaxID=1936171 RepID=UPI002632F40F|nr:hypothetical protein [uncultured Roseibium sp.]
MDQKVSDRQIISELDEIQHHLMKKYGPEGVANEKLQDQLKEFGRKGDDHWDARKLIEGALVHNRTRSRVPETQEQLDKILQQRGELGKVGPGVSGFGNSAGGRRRAREFLGIGEPEPALRMEPEEERGIELLEPTPNDGVWHGVRSNGPGNPFSIQKPKLKQQAEMLEQNPAGARQMILAAGRDPELFGL